MSTFSQAVDAIGKLAAAEQELLLVELAKLVQFRRGGDSPVHISGQDGTTVGYLFPPGPRSNTPPVLTPEEEAELRRDMENPGDFLTTEQMRELIRQGAPEAAAKP